ncbi:MAG: putative Zinc finger/thioredoxin [Tardiphaga sp.]|nr:putative Zinc finger/thioredoxin [Tardiphaga sp.]
MPIVCPHCATSYAVDSSTLGPEGRTVRCARCKEVWLARPDDSATQDAARELVPAMAFGRRPPPPPEDDAAWGIDPAQDDDEPPRIDSPSIASEMPAEPAWVAAAQTGHVIDAQADETPVHEPKNRRTSRFGRRPQDKMRLPKLSSLFTLPTGCVAMAALVAALVFWRGDMVRLLPQTAAYYKLLGFEVNLRGLAFKDIKLSNETVDGKTVLVIEGNIVAQARTAVELPRLRFVVRDGKGTEIYAWNAVLEQAALQPGDKAWFRSRLAAPPPDGQTLDIRFFNKRDIAAGTA